MRDGLTNEIMDFEDLMEEKELSQEEWDQYHSLKEEYFTNCEWE